MKEQFSEHFKELAVAKTFEETQIDLLKAFFAENKVHVNRFKTSVYPNRVTVYVALKRWWPWKTFKIVYSFRKEPFSVEVSHRSGLKLARGLAQVIEDKRKTEVVVIKDFPLLDGET